MYEITVDDDVTRCTLAEFLAVNEDLCAEERDAVAALTVGATYQGGGGAGAEWSARRVALWCAVITGRLTSLVLH
jgi:hypothetical protein